MNASGNGEKNYKLKDYSNTVAIHDLYANTLFEFRFPMSETESYYLLQDCLVALYYQLYFLGKQCWSGRTSGEGWGYCKYGEGVKCDDGEKGVNGTGCLSWICPLGNKSQHEKEKDKCGKDEKSPLQAFLTDCLKGFTCGEVMEGKSQDGKENLVNLGKLRKDSGTSTDRNKKEMFKHYTDAYPGFLDHRKHTEVFGQECAVPMGFSGSFKSGGAAAPGADGMIGLGINAITSHYANDDLTDSCLYQITRCICSLTRRVPRSTGTLYGFFYGLGGVYSGSGQQGEGVKAFKDAFEQELAVNTPSLGGDAGELITVIGTWRGSKDGHKKPGDCCSLSSLSDCSGATQSSTSSTCGAYLHPLTGSLYNSVATQYCDTYLSWIIHLTGVLKTGLESLQKAFKDIDCSKSGCVKANNGVIQAGNCECRSKGCIPSTHGNSNNCCCHSVVHCAGVYSVFYRFGFSYVSPFGLSKTHIRKCDHFYKQLQNVITGDLFSDLLKQINRFLYTTRLPFTLVIFGFWSIVLLYLLWSITGPLDLLHIQSHWRSPRSYLVPLQRILADGSRNVKRVCTLGYFQEANGDRLLSQGVSDVYL